MIRRTYGRIGKKSLSFLQIAVIITTLSLVLSLHMPSEAQNWRISDENSLAYATKPACSNNSVFCLIHMYSHNYNIDTDIAIRIAECESHLNYMAKNTGSTASGVYQITRGTFLDGIKKRSLEWEENDVFDAHKNIDMALWYMSKGQYWRWDASSNCWKI